MRFLSLRSFVRFARPLEEEKFVRCFSLALNEDEEFEECGDGYKKRRSQEEQKHSPGQGSAWEGSNLDISRVRSCLNVIGWFMFMPALSILVLIILRNPVSGYELRFIFLSLVSNCWQAIGPK